MQKIDKGTFVKYNNLKDITPRRFCSLMNKNNVEFKKISLINGSILLIFVGLSFAIIDTFYPYLASIIALLIKSESIATIASALGRCVLYCGMFMAPAFLYKLFSRSLPAENSIKEKSHLTFPLAVLIILSSIGIITTCAYINALLCTLFTTPSDGTTEKVKMTVTALILSVIADAFVPAISEELLFRRTILRSLAPYGKGFAIVSSAIIFGLMHQNAYQFFYATMAGIILGYAYVKTNSFLCVFLIHFCNNLTGVVQEYIASSLNEKASLIAGTILTATLSVLGIASFIILMFIEKNKKSVYETGSFGKIKAPSILYVPKPVTINRAKVFFLCPTVLIFTIISVILTVMTILG